MCLCAMRIDFASFYDFSIEILTVPTVCQFLCFILSELVCCREELCQTKTDLDELKEMSDTQKEKQDRMIKEYVYISNCY